MTFKKNDYDTSETFISVGSIENNNLGTVPITLDPANKKIYLHAQGAVYSCDLKAISRRIRRSKRSYRLGDILMEVC